MKRPVMLKIVLAILIALLGCTLLFNLFYFRHFHNNLSIISKSEKQKAIGILNKSMNLDNAEIHVLNTYVLRDRSLILLELVKNNSRENYLIDLKEGKIMIR